MALAQFDMTDDSVAKAALDELRAATAAILSGDMPSPEVDARKPKRPRFGAALDTEPAPRSSAEDQGQRSAPAGGRLRGTVSPFEGSEEPHAVARNIVLRQLTHSAKSRHQLALALAKRGCSEDVANDVLDRMEQVGLVDDEAYAAAFVQARTHHKGLARRALSHELRRKGVADDVIEAATQEVHTEDEYRMARALVDKRLRQLHGLDPHVQTRRLAGMLARKGYDSGVALAVIRDALAVAPEHQRD